MSPQGACAPRTQLRTLHFIDNLGPGGKERQLVELLKGLDRVDACESLVVAMTEGVFYRELLALQRVTVTTLIRRSRRDLRAFLGFHRMVRSFRPDVIVVWDHLTALYAIPAIWLGSAAVVNAMVRDAPVPLTATARRRAWLAFPWADVIVANSQAGLDAYGVRSGKGRVIHNGIDAARLVALEDPAAVRQRLGLGDALLVGMVSTFRPWKDQATLIHAAGLILHQRRDVVFLFIGDGETRAACQQLVAPALSGRIRFLGSVALELEALVNALDIGVLATFTEGLPNAVLEYMALGKPVVASDGGGTRELLLDGETGFLVPPRHPQRLADCLTLLLDDPALRQRMGQAGRQRVLAHFGLARMVAQQLALYQGLARHRQTGR